MAACSCASCARAGTAAVGPTPSGCTTTATPSTRAGGGSPSGDTTRWPGTDRDLDMFPLPGAPRHRGARARAGLAAAAGGIIRAGASHGSIVGMPLLVVRHAQAGSGRPTRGRPAAPAHGPGPGPGRGAGAPAQPPTGPGGSCRARSCGAARRSGPWPRPSACRVESVDELAEGHGADAVRLVTTMAGESAVLCTHGDVATRPPRVRWSGHRAGPTARRCGSRRGRSGWSGRPARPWSSWSTSAGPPPIRRSRRSGADQYARGAMSDPCRFDPGLCRRVPGHRPVVRPRLEDPVAPLRLRPGPRVRRDRHLRVRAAPERCRTGPAPTARGFERALLHLHIAAGTSYYKVARPAAVVIEGDGLTPSESAFHHHLYDDGLREFAVTNRLAVPRPVSILHAAGPDPAPRPPPGRRRGAAACWCPSAAARTPWC